MLHATVVPSARSAEIGKTRSSKKLKKRITSSGVILSGIARLLTGQKRFAEELGLPYSRVLDEEFRVFRDKDPGLILREWLQDKVDGPQKFNRLINGFVEHNLALYAALDGIALESISQLSPKAVKKASFSILGWRPFAWLTFRRLHRSYSTNDYLRHQEMIVNGFTKAYCAHRETLQMSKVPVSRYRNPNTRKETL